MLKDKIKGVPETMLQTLYARAEETLSGRGYINDIHAVDIVSKIDYDFSNAAHDKAMSTGVIARTILLDSMTMGFLESHPGTTVINIACGLDTRCYRMAGHYSMWYDLDLPGSIDIRSMFIKETDNIKQLAFSAMDSEWAGHIPHFSGPVLIIIEGLTMYLSEENVKKIFSIIDMRFRNATVFVEVMSPWAVSHIKERSIEGSSAAFTWGAASGRIMETIVPPFVSIEDHSLTEGMKVFIPFYRILDRIGPVRNISNKILVMQKSL